MAPARPASRLCCRKSAAWPANASPWCSRAAISTVRSIPVSSPKRLKSLMSQDKTPQKSTNSDGASRAAALQLLQAVLHHRRSIDDAFDNAARGLEPRDRAFVRLLVATTLRRIGQID